MISPNLADNGTTRLPFQPQISPPLAVEKSATEKAAAAIKMTNFSIAAIMNNHRKLASEAAEDDFEAKRRKLAEAVPALGKTIVLEGLLVLLIVN